VSGPSNVVLSSLHGPRVTVLSASSFSRTSADGILCIADRFWDLMPLRRDQKLFPHFGEAGTAVFAVKEVEYGGHDPTSLFELICTINSKLSFILGSRM
jgi:hypothetical protein